MKYEYPKYRELDIEPCDIEFKNIKFKEILNYMPAGNDVLECLVEYDNEERNVYIKIERSKVACFDVENEHITKLLSNNYYDKLPKVIEYGKIFEKSYIVLDKIIGDRMSLLFENNKNIKSDYLYKYGAELGRIHKINIDGFNVAKQRIINDYPKKENYKEMDSFIEKYVDYLKKNKPNIEFDTFIHGDFHYANILWEDNEINGVLDFEYSGVGFKEQDIAWALVLRPNQKFLDNIEDINSFLKGYESINTYDKEKLIWCLINGYCHFYLMNLNNDTYIKKIKEILECINRL